MGVSAAYILLSPDLFFFNMPLEVLESIEVLV